MSMRILSEGSRSADRILREVPQTDLMDTTRRYARTTAEAFKDERAPAVEVHRPVSHALRDLILAVTIGVFVAAALVKWWSS